MKYMAIAVFIVFFLVSLSFSGIINVPADTLTIQGGIYLASDGDTVLVAEDTYFENINFKGKAITVASKFIMDGDTSHISKTIIDGSQPSDPDSGSVVIFISGEDTTSVLCGFTITGGAGGYSSITDGYGGGGVLMFSSGGKIINNKIIHNTLESQKQCHGAGLTVFLTSTSHNVVIEQNEIKENSIISSDMCGGGGIYCKWIPLDGYLRINNNVISDNSVTCSRRYKAYGGGLGISLNLPTSVDIHIKNNSISKNELHCVASMGAGIYIVYWEPGGIITDNFPSPIISNNIIYDNYSEDRGAGIGIWTVEINHQASSVITPQPAIINNTIVNNKANDGSGLFNFDSYPLLMNNIFWNDLSVEGSREIFNDDINYPDYTDTNQGELHIYYSDIQEGWEGEGNIDSDPQFADTSSNDFSLLASSRCVGNGIDSINVQDYWYQCPDFDYYGKVRPHSIDEFVDMGAIESEFPNEINDSYTSFPFIYRLKQNYPNPFNPVTKITYELPITNYIDLSIYNLLGQKVATLVSEKQKAGYHQVQWDASGFASGVYYYQLVAGEYSEVKKMILLR